MSFSDLISSSRGPGVIGTLLALVILGGFGTLYLFVFDEGLQGGGKRIEAVIRDQGIEIEGLRSQIADRKEKLAEGQKFREQADEIERVRSRSESGAKRVADMEAERDAASSALNEARQKFEDYKDAYRASEWAAVVGERFDELKTLSGAVYKNAVIRKVDQIGVEITDETGNRRINSADLPSELQDRLQFDEVKKELASLQEEEEFKSHAGNMEIATLAKQAQDKLLQIRDLKERNAKSTALVQKFRNEDYQMRNRISGQKTAISVESAKKGGISRAPQMRDELRQMEEAYANAKRAAAAAENEIRRNESQISRIEREVNELRGQISRLKDANASAAENP